MKCKRRNIIDIDKADKLATEAEKILAKLNGYIRFVAKSPKHNKMKDPV